jgi:N-acetylmuramoyl-L-alanine amidase
MSSTLFILDPGHGDFVDGVNHSKQGKYSPKFEDGTRFYEGHNNRDNVKRIIEHFDNIKLDCVDITGGSILDVPLASRVSLANKLGKNRQSLYISMHSNALGNGEEWYAAKGISVHTSPGQTKSDIFASILIDELEKEYGNSVQWRKDLTDGDKDIENKFYVLTETSMPAVLIEAGFHTNKEEVRRMMTDDWKVKLVNAITNACLKWDDSAASHAG